MKVCIPVSTDSGIDSPVCEHFGSAPFFMLVDSDTLAVETITNGNAHHAHGMCQPLAALNGHDVGALIVGGIGAGALNKLAAAGITVFRATQKTVRETMASWKSGSLSKVDPGSACAGHGHPHP